MSRYGSTVSMYHVGKTTPGFVANARRLLQVKSAVHYEMGHKHGKLAPSRMWRVGMPPIDSGDWNSRIFKQKRQESDVFDTCFTCLVDWSGSMGGDKATAAAKAAGYINEAFANTLHMPVEILSFSSHGDQPVMGVIKSYGRKATNDQIAERFYSFLDYMSGNNDADSLLWAYDRILKRKEKRKLLFVLSDGSPADGLGDPVYALKQVTSRIEQERRVELYGIGIRDTNVERFYKKHHVIRYGEDIESGLIAVLSKALS